MILGVDASNIRDGGGVTHLVELLRIANPQSHGFKQVIVWGGSFICDLLEEKPWLLKVRQPLLDKSLLYRVYWQLFCLSKAANYSKCNVLFIPGGTYFGNFSPYVTMSQNMLPFDWHELRSFGFSLNTLRLLLLYFSQSYTFRKAASLIFLTNYAKNKILSNLKYISGTSQIIPHGISEELYNVPRKQNDIVEYSLDNPLRLVYVSIINMYKHQWHVVEAVAQLRLEGYPLVLELVGPANPVALKRLKSTINRLDPTGEFILYSGPIQHSKLPEKFLQAQICLFASSCENMPIILLEGMASGLPIACSDRMPMPEVLLDSGVYFDPENVTSISNAIKVLINQPDLRTKLAGKSYLLAKNFSWEKCARDTFDLIAKVGMNHKN